MKYRVKEVQRKHLDTGEWSSVFYPQHKHWWCPWWHHYGDNGEYSDWEWFDTLEKAIAYINWTKEEKYKVIYHTI